MLLIIKNFRVTVIISCFEGMRIMDFVFWQNIISPHQSSVLKELSSKENCKITLVVEEEIPTWRKAMGWQIEDLGNVDIVIAPDKKKVSNIIDNKKDAINIFSGINSYKLVRTAMKLCIRKKRRIGIMAEARDISGFKGFLRVLKGRYEKLIYDRNIEFILAIGKLGLDYYKKIGFSENKIYPYGYFLERKEFSDSKEESLDTKFRVFYVGRCIYLKGIDILLKALGKHKDLNWELEIVGDGEYKSELISLTSNLGIDKRVIFHGTKSNDEVRRLLKNADLLVLPSRKKDGWGTVVNEALMNGVPVICSDMCGASLLLNHPDLGEIFQHESEEQLSEILRRRIKKGKNDKSLKEDITLWSKCIEGSSAAHYIVNIIRSLDNHSQKPLPPWESSKLRIKSERLI